MSKNLFLLSALILFSISIHAQNTFPSTGAAGIGTTTPNASSLLDVTSTTKGLLVPRMIKTQRDAIVAPATGLLIFQTNSTPGFYYYSGTAWTAVTAKGANTSLSNLAATVAVNQSLVPNANGTLNLGSSTLGWNNVYGIGSYYIGANKVIDISGTGNTFLGATGNTANTGSDNSFVGNSAGHSNSSGSYNSANGFHALYSNTTGASNTGIGFNALYTNSGGNYNTGVGLSALYFNTTGSNNTATGVGSLFSNTTGSNNTAYGYNALNSNTTGFANVASGNNALYSNTYGAYNTATGYNALYSSKVGSANTAMGYYALYSDDSGYNNTASGYYALYSNKEGTQNTATGDHALYSNSSGNGNTASGAYALYADTSGYDNTAMGQFALQLNVGGAWNAAFGWGALFNNTWGSNNVADGVDALVDNTTGSSNTAVGLFSFNYNTTGNYNTSLGYYAGGSTGTLSNATAVGYLAVVDASNKVRIGNTSVTSNGGQVSWSTYSDARIKDNVQENVPGLTFIKELRPVTFHYNVTKENKLLGIRDTAKWNGKYDIEKIQFTGFLAQDVDEAAKKVGYDFSGVDKSGAIMGLRYSDFVVPLVKSVQELSAKNDSKDSTIADQQKQIDELTSAVVQLKSVVSAQQSTSSNGYVELKTLNLKPETILGQNIPNPFDNSTLIPFRIPKDCHDASIMITNVSSSEVISVIPISCNEDHVSIDAGTLASGAYSYTLYVDGKMIDTKNMVLQK